KTREGVKGSLFGFGGAFAGRGGDLNRTIQRLPDFLGVVAPVLRNLSDVQTDLPGFFKELNDAARVVAPVSKNFAHAFSAQADTFDAISRDP
ncbi:hypothetical protein, partial [Halalkalibacter lacteus]|uniref:hypothetical protein n=1 Tax=Halalkalibacter lacteus TaxID=3090663 RepID=UPI002FCBA75D